MSVLFIILILMYHCQTSQQLRMEKIYHSMLIETIEIILPFWRDNYKLFHSYSVANTINEKYVRTELNV